MGGYPTRGKDGLQDDKRTEPAGYVSEPGEAERSAADGFPGERLPDAGYSGGIRQLYRGAGERREAAADI